MPNTLKVYTIYHNPKDYPDMWVMRVHEVPGGARKDCVVENSLEKIRAHVPMGLVCLARYDDDDPIIYETWL